ncbi:MAG TPA: 4Fe-4S binding protein [Clostridia bacterium]|nr:4Fe-4S binding protein [Clostridia bacterium]
MREYTASLKREAERLLSEGRVKTVIAFGPGIDPLAPIPAFAEDKDEASDLLVNAFSAPGLAKYVLDEVGGVEKPEHSVAVLARGCDSLGIARLIADKRVQRQSVVILGVHCDGVIDRGKLLALNPAFSRTKNIKSVAIGEDEVFVEAELADRSAVSLRGRPEDLLLDKCLKCLERDPVVFDIMLEPEAGTMLGRETGPTPVGDRGGVDQGEKEKSLRARRSLVAETEALSSESRYEFWARQFERCIRCYACRNVCPACSCRKCAFDVPDPEWVSKCTWLSEQFMFHFLRAFHVAGRCVGCGECERACPMGLPLSLLNDKLMKDVEEMFGIEDPHVPKESEPLGFYSPDDPEPWAKEVSEG